jgi:hypothetical protein
MFSGRADFTSATFAEEAYFNSAAFSGLTNFTSATFSSYASFEATFSGPTDFTSARFSHTINFRNAKFGTMTMFARSDFGDQVPDFRGATMHEATEWHGAIWPKPPKDSTAARSQVHAYGRLVQEMDRLKKHEDEQFFFRKQLRASRALGGRGEWILNFLYEKSSNYGYSVAAPLKCLFWLWIAGAVFYVTRTMAPGTVPSPEAFQRAFVLSAANLIPFVPITHDFISANAVGTEKIVCVAQSLIATPLLFLLGLALRNRFRMK